MWLAGGLVSVEDASCLKLTELMLNVEEVSLHPVTPLPCAERQ